MLKHFKKILLSLLILSFLALPLQAVRAESIDALINMMLMGPVLGSAVTIGQYLTGNGSTTSTMVGQIPNILIGQIGAGIVSGVLSLLISMGSTLASFSYDFLAWVISPGFMTTSITSNSIVTYGWGEVRNIANIALIFGLIVIAISIILGFQEGKAKKTLINFILIALLINFTPVICGLIIDASNLIMNSFLNNMAINIAPTHLLTGHLTGNSTDGTELVLMAKLIYFIFSLMTTVIYFLYALLFIARYAVLWILVIASPLAFASKVFPKYDFVNKLFPKIFYWDEWWNQFLQWCILGITAAFSLYLSNKIMTAVSTNAAMYSSSPPTGSTAVGFSDVLAYVIPFVFLIAGFFISMDSGGKVGSVLGGVAMGAWAATGGKAITAGKNIGGRAATVAKEGATGIGGAIITGKNPLSFENREEGRRVLDKSLTFGAPNAKDDKAAAQEYLKTHKGAYDFRTRENLKKEQINKNTGDYLDSADTPEKLKAAVRDIEVNGNQKAKEFTAVYLAGKTDVLKDGYTNFVTNNKIDIKNKIEGMSPKTAQKEISAKALGNWEVLKNMNSKQVGYIYDNGSEKQRAEMKDRIWGKGQAEFAQKMSDLIKTSQNKVPGKTISPADMAKAKEEYDRMRDIINTLIAKEIK